MIDKEKLNINAIEQYDAEYLLCYHESVYIANHSNLSIFKGNADKQNFYSTYTFDKLIYLTGLSSLSLD